MGVEEVLRKGWVTGDPEHETSSRDGATVNGAKGVLRFVDPRLGNGGNIAVPRSLGPRLINQRTLGVVSHIIK